ncbi:MAG: energy transducer TonB [Acidobacteriota bacterium]|nr:energy transducer TonB [Acidobacteriota bacterium]
MTKRLLLVMIVLGSAGALTAQTSTLRAKSPFQPAEARLVTGILYSNTCVGAGTVVMDALITETGEVKQVEVRRDVGCFTQFAVQNVKTWKFAPATFAGKAVASRVPVAVTFDPLFPSGDPIVLSPLIPQSAAAIQAQFQPAEVTRVLLPHAHPGYSFAEGTVVLEVTLSEKGEAEEIKVLRDIPPFTEGARAAVGDWRFLPATFNGRPVQSTIVLAFVSPPYFPAKPTPE